jgi:hypothetical protein
MVMLFTSSARLANEFFATSAAFVYISGLEASVPGQVGLFSGGEIKSYERQIQPVPPLTWYNQYQQALFQHRLHRWRRFWMCSFNVPLKGDFWSKCSLKTGHVN